MMTASYEIDEPARAKGTESAKSSTIHKSKQLSFGRFINGLSDCAQGVVTLAKKVFRVVQTAFSEMNEKVQQKFSQVKDIKLHVSIKWPRNGKQLGPKSFKPAQATEVLSRRILIGTGEKFVDVNFRD